MNKLKNKAANSLFWSGVERFSVQGIQYIVTIILARLLMPSDYGLIAMLMVFFAIAQTFIDGGFANALIQKKERSQVDYATVFFFNIAISLLLYVILYFCAPFIASFYNEEKLTLLAKVAGLVLIINSFGIVQQTILTVALDFKRQAIASLTAVVISGCVGVAMAYGGFGVWALVWHTLINNLLRVLLLWIFARWKPIFTFSKESFRVLFSFGSKLLLSSLLHTIYTNIYTLVIGKKFADVELGYFNRASTLAQFPSTNFTNIIVRAVYPMQCAMQDDTEGLNKMFLSYLRMACFVIFPIMVILAVMAQPLIELMLTDKWLPAAPLFQIMCVAYMWDPVMKINHNMLNVKGRSDFFLKAEVIKKVVAAVILIATIPFGIKVMTFGLIAYSFADMVIIIHYSKKLTDIGLMQQIKQIAPLTLLSLAMGAFVYVIMMLVDSVALKVVLGLFSGVVFYFVVSYLLRLKEIGTILSLVRKGKK